MKAEDVEKVLDELSDFAPRIWIDGGWGVDALVAEQTREHSDLDLAVDHDHVSEIEQALAAIGFEHDPTATPGLPARLVLSDGRGRQIDIHPLHFDAGGSDWQQLSDTGRAWGRYPADHMQASGVIAGRRVQFLSAELQVRFRLGYEWSSRDDHDIRHLAARFDITSLPPPFWR